MSSLSRMLAVLDLFTGTTPSWTAEAITETLGYSRPTGYRYVRELAAAGLLRRGSGGTYWLGTRAIELDYQIRITDPLLLAGAAPMRAMADATGCDVVLGSVYGDHVITVHQEHGGEGISATYGRGRNMPLFRGMLSKMLLASIARAQLRRIHAAHAEEAAAQAFSADWETLVANLKAIRSAGHCVSHGELDPGLVGVAVPMVSREHETVAALGLILTKQRYATSDVSRMVRLLRETADQILGKLGPTATGA
jgi:DNA-binding IclR family transcriptional regulator